jgi:A nuclease family of the HNH/ENDO VII superfamily with conserved AHH
MAKSHITKLSIAKLHKRQKQTDDGACLTGHEGGYLKNNSCSYRWQAHSISLADRTDMYDDLAVPAPPAGGIATNAYRSKKSKLVPAWYVTALEPPEPGDWNLAGPKRKIKRKSNNKRTDTIPIGKNFTKDRWPYWHNSHHLIPKSLLREVINASADGDGVNPLAPSIIRKCLLVAKYNVNHTVNMILLPQDREVGKILGLPRHLILKELAGPGLDARTEVASHRDYDCFVEERLTKIISDFAARIDKKNCVDAEDPQTNKQRLEKLSRELLQQIKAFGADRLGRPLADMRKPKPPTTATPSSGDDY